MNYFDGLTFTTFGDIPESAGGSRDKVFDGYYGIQYTHSGKLVFSVDGSPEEVFEGPCVFFSAPGRVYNYTTCASETRHHCWICFQGPRAEAFRAGGLFDPYEPCPVHRIAKPEQFYKTMLEVQALLQHPGGYREARKVLLLEDLLLQIQEQEPLPARVNAFCEQSIRALRRSIVSAPQAKWNFGEEAEKMSISVSHFRRIFRELTGYAPTRFLIECRLNRAMKLLTDTARPLCEIAHESGFDDEFYFSRLFKQHRGRTPSAYRKEFRL